jgi:hypothetical protein
VETLALDAVAVKGVVAVIVAVAVFIGSVLLLLSLVLGPRLAYFLTGSIVFGVMVILSLIWFGSKLGPKGSETTWLAIGAGPDLKEVEHGKTKYDVSDYPGGDWAEPKEGAVLVEGAGDTKGEAQTAEPILDTFVADVVNVIPGVREEVSEKVHGEVKLIPQEFSITDVRLKKEDVAGKPSLIAIGTAVPSDKMIAEDIGGAEEGDIKEVTLKEGDAVQAGQPVMKVKTDKGEVEVKAPMAGKVVEIVLSEGDKIKPGVPYGTVDITGQPGQPEPAQVVGVRVRGSVRTPSIYYIVASLLGFAVHMRGLARTERSLKAQTQTA